MKSYYFHIADFVLATNHLDRIERSIYFDLINRYYDTEKPLCSDISKLAKRIRAIGDESIVENILEEFFHQKEGVWHHYRCDEELEKIYEKSEQARDAANKRWAKQNGSEQNADGMRPHSERTADGMLPITHNPLPIKNNSSKFEEFWSAYPRKSGKKKSQTAFNRLTIAKQSKAIADAPIRYTETDKQFIPYPATYIHNEYWNDDIPGNSLDETNKQNRIGVR